MKLRIVALCGAMACLALPAFCQTQSGSWEFSLTGNGGVTSTSTEYTFQGHTNTNEGEGQNYIGLDLRPGYYLVDGFSLEPEIYWLAVEKSTPLFNLGLNAAYTFTIPESPVKPYLTAGYGIGNSNPMMQRLFAQASDKLDVPVLRVGGGLKIFVSRQVALKAEYRYERYTQESSGGYYGYSYSYKATSNLHNILIGFSVFLPSEN